MAKYYFKVHMIAQKCLPVLSAGSKWRESASYTSVWSVYSPVYRLWGAERIRGELLKLDIRVSKRTIQKYMKQIRAISSPRTELEDISAQSCIRGVGL